MSQQKHTPGPYSYGEDNDGWYLESLSAKEKLGHGDQIAYCLSENDARRISACLNACEGVRTEHLENNLPIVELVGRHSEALREIEALKAERAELAGALNALVDDINALVSESHGVVGLHRNGDVATWDEILPGGRFERMSSLELAESAITKAAEMMEAA